MPSAGKWMELEIIMLRDISKLKKGSCGEQIMRSL
jgi:hypothetical protein